MEKFAEDAELLGQLREFLREHGMLRSTVIEGKETEGAKFRDWFDFAEADHQHALAPRPGAAARPQ
jgi:uncharacterized protein